MVANVCCSFRRGVHTNSRCAQARCEPRRLNARACALRLTIAAITCVCPVLDTRERYTGHTMTDLSLLAYELDVSDRTLRRAAARGTVRCVRRGQRLELPVQEA